MRKGLGYLYNCRISSTEDDKNYRFLAFNHFALGV